MGELLLEDRVAVISGAGQGIGLGIARAFGREGARVIIGELVADRGEAAASALASEGHRVQAIPLDVTAPDSCTSLVESVLAEHGRIDILVNCAGICLPNTVENATLEEWHATLAVNVDGTFFGCQSAVAAMKDRGGAIVNFSSISGLTANADMFAYDASKGAVRGMTKEVAIYCCARGYAIRCNSVHPGTIETPMVTSFFDEHSDDPSSWVAAQAIKRFGTPDEVAAMVAFLASDDSSFSTGAEFVIDGGLMAGETQGWE